MTRLDLNHFRRMCGQFRWLAVFMVISVGTLMAMMHIVFPGLAMLNGREAAPLATWISSTVWASPGVFYLYAVWAIGTAMGEVANGRLIQPTLAQALRRVGVALGCGGLLSVFGITNISRLVDGAQASWAYFDVASMTLGMIGGALFLLGKIIDQAGLLQSELDEII